MARIYRKDCENRSIRRNIKYSSRRGAKHGIKRDIKSVNPAAGIGGKPDKGPGVRAAEIIERLITERRRLIDDAINKYFPKDINEEKIAFICGRPTYEYDVEALRNAVYVPGWDLLDRGGKRWRPLLMMLVIEALGKDPKKFIDFLVIPEVVHNGTLIIDDIEDGSLMRRNKDCVHVIYGTDIAINAGNAMYYIPLLPLIKKRGEINDSVLTDLYEIYIQEMINISHGQAMDIYWHRGKKTGISEKQYLQMCAYKSGTLARMSAKMGAVLSGADRETVNAFGRFAESIAVAFQIQDDILNLNEKLGKERGEDIKEGKRSLLVIRALSVLGEKDKKRLIEILDMHTGDEHLIDEAISLVRSTDAFEYSRNLASSLIKNAWTELQRLIPKGKSSDNLRLFAEYLIERTR